MVCTGCGRSTDCDGAVCRVRPPDDSSARSFSVVGGPLLCAGCSVAFCSETCTAQTLGSSDVAAFLPGSLHLMQALAAELARVTAERTRLQRLAQKARSRQHKQREHAFLAATIAFCCEPTAGSAIAEATRRKCARVMESSWPAAHVRSKIASSGLR